MKEVSKSTPNVVVTANSPEELKNLTSELVNHGWTSDGEPVQNEDGTYSARMVRV